MTPTFPGIALATALTLALVAPVAADPGRGRHHDNDRNHAHQGCPPGLAKKSPSCVPPGQAKRDDIRYGRGVGDRLRVEDYVLVRDLNRYDVERRGVGAITAATISCTGSMPRRVRFWP